jgi:hypothetical protein
MKAQFVYENINFERGQDPKKALGLGKIPIVQVVKFNKPTGSTGYFDWYTKLFFEDLYRDTEKNGGVIPKLYNSIGFKTEDNRILFLRDLLGKSVGQNDNVYQIPSHSEFQPEGKMYYSDINQISRDPNPDIVNNLLR